MELQVIVTFTVAAEITADPKRIDARLMRPASAYNAPDPIPTRFAVRINLWADQTVPLVRFIIGEYNFAELNLKHPFAEHVT